MGWELVKDGRYEDAVDGNRDVLLRYVARHHETLEGLQEGARVHRLVEVEAVVGGLQRVINHKGTILWSRTVPRITSRMSLLIFLLLIL